VRHHQLVPVPIDIDPATLAPRLEAIEAAITPRTRAVVIAHLFGSRVPLDPLLPLAREHGLVVIEDLAQGLCDPRDRGHGESDVAMFSFGPIKTATALGGGLLAVRDAALLARMRRITAGYPRQSRRAFLSRVAKYAAIKALSGPRTYGVLAGLVQRMGRDPDRVFAGLVRGFPAGELVPRLRRQPSAPLIALMRRRLDTWDAGRIERRSRIARRFIQRLETHFVFPGAAATEHSHWVVPLLARDPPALLKQLAAHGFHAARPRSLCVVTAPVDRPHLCALAAETLLEHALFLPLYPELPDAEQCRLGDVLWSLAAEQGTRRESQALSRESVSVV
jgi:perosamine synthetase